MIQLALETSSRAASISVHPAKGVPVVCSIEPTRPTTAALLVEVQVALQRAGATAKDVGLISVTRGPGSFTGLRVGVTTAKTLAYAVRCPIVGVSTLEVIARQAVSSVGSARSITAILDAHRGQWFSATFDVGADGEWVEAQGTRVVDPDKLVKSLDSGSLISGPPLNDAWSQMATSCGLMISDPTVWHPLSTTVAEIGWQRLELGQLDDSFGLLPEYYRPSAAEERRIEPLGQD